MGKQKSVFFYTKRAIGLTFFVGLFFSLLIILGNGTKYGGNFVSGVYQINYLGVNFFTITKQELEVGSSSTIVAGLGVWLINVIFPLSAGATVWFIKDRHK